MEPSQGNFLDISYCNVDGFVYDWVCAAFYFGRGEFSRKKCMKNCESIKLRLLEMATAQRTRPRAVVGAPRLTAWQLKSALRHSISAAPRTIIFWLVWM